MAWTYHYQFFRKIIINHNIVPAKYISNSLIDQTFKLKVTIKQPNYGNYLLQQRYNYLMQ